MNHNFLDIVYIAKGCLCLSVRSKLNHHSKLVIVRSDSGLKGPNYYRRCPFTSLLNILIYPFYIVSCYIKMDKTFWKYGSSRYQKERSFDISPLGPLSVVANCKKVTGLSTLKASKARVSESTVIHSSRIKFSWVEVKCNFVRKCL